MKDDTKSQGLRNQLVDLLKNKGISNTKVLEAIRNVPRHWFMESGLESYAYEDKAYPISENQTISQPYTVAFQTCLLNLNFGDKILEIGTGSGYQTSILIELGAKVYSVERQSILFKKAELLFRKLKWKPKKLIFGDGGLGYSKGAPFDGIIVTAGAPVLPNELLNQLSLGGRLVIPIGIDKQIMTKFTRLSNNEFNKETFGSFKFVPLLKNKN